MTDIGRTCNAESCDQPATQVGVLDLPGRRVELGLCDDHVEKVQSGVGTSLRQDRDPSGGFRPPVAHFLD